MAYSIVKNYLNDKKVVIKADITIQHTKGDEVVEINEFQAERISATKWKVYKDNKFFFFCKAHNLGVLTGILERLRFSEIS